MDFEQALASVWGRGFYQIALAFVLSFCSFILAYELEFLVFMNYTPTFNCTDDRLNNATDVRWDETASAIAKHQCVGWLKTAENSTWESFTCGQWSFDQSVMRSTLVSEFNLVCGSRHITTLIETLFLFGIAVGNGLSIVGDYIGRRRMILICVSVEVLIIVSTPLSNSLIAIIILRALRGVTSPVGYHCVCLMSEIVPMNKRSIFGNNFWIPWGIGYMTAGGIAYWTREWRHIGFALYVPVGIYLSYYFLVPESPRWYGLKNRNEEAVVVLKRIAKWNRAKVQQNNVSVAFTTDAERKGNFIDAFRSPSMRLKTLVLCLGHCAIALSYAGLSISPTFASDNIFINVILQGLTEIPGSPTAWILSDKLGRRLSVSSLMGIVGVGIIATFYIPDTIKPLKIAVALVSKLCLVSSYCIADLYITEVFPTSIRNVGMFVTLTAAALAAAFAPIINRFAERVAYVPAIIYGIIMSSSGVVTYLCLPETKDCPLAQTVEQAERLRRGNEKEWTKQMLFEMDSQGTDVHLINENEAKDVDNSIKTDSRC